MRLFDVCEQREAATGRKRSAQILARTLYRELVRRSFGRRAIVALSSELIGLVAEDIRQGRS